MHHNALTIKNNAMNIGMDNLKSFEIQQKKRSQKIQKYYHKISSFARYYKAGIPNYFLLFLKVRLQFSLKIALFGVL